MIWDTPHGKRLISMNEFNQMIENGLKYGNPFESGVPFKKTSPLGFDRTYGFEHLVEIGAWNQDQLDEFYANPYIEYERIMNKERNKQK